MVAIVCVEPRLDQSVSDLSIFLCASSLGRQPVCDVTFSNSIGSSGRPSGRPKSRWPTSHHTMRCCAPFCKGRSSTMASHRPRALPSASAGGAFAAAWCSCKGGWSIGSTAAANSCNSCRRRSGTQAFSSLSTKRLRTCCAVSNATAISAKATRNESFQRPAAALKPLAPKTATRLVWEPFWLSPLGRKTSITTPAISSTTKSTRSRSRDLK
mmetsp:Transcript_48956/g.137766  ORF Transcript_48956/g.137766 Transcript_48956/m.137766 type:complete len:212 (-) Transcript_48956:90-725(-)